MTAHPAGVIDVYHRWLLCTVPFKVIALLLSFTCDRPKLCNHSRQSQTPTWSAAASTTDAPPDVSLRRNPHGMVLLLGKGTNKGNGFREPLLHNKDVNFTGRSKKSRVPAKFKGAKGCTERAFVQTPNLRLNRQKATVYTCP